MNPHIDAVGKGGPIEDEKGVIHLIPQLPHTTGAGHLTKNLTPNRKEYLLDPLQPQDQNQEGKRDRVEIPLVRAIHLRGRWIISHPLVQ